jgi:kojibiose phosphorylase
MLGVPPAFCAVVEDAAAGVDAALAAGMWAVGLGPVERVGHAHARFDSLEGVTLAKLCTALDDAAWTVAEPVFDPTHQQHQETIFTIGNGALCMRGTFEEGYPGENAASFMHRLWDDMPVNYTELANLPRWWGVDLWVNGVRFRLDRGTVLNYRRWLDLRTGVLARTVRWQPAEGGPVLDLRFERFISLAVPHPSTGSGQVLAAVQVKVEVVAGQADLRLRTGLDAHVENTGLVHWDLVAQEITPDTAAVHVRTRATKLDLAVAAAVEDPRQGVDLAPPAPPSTGSGQRPGLEASAGLVVNGRRSPSGGRNRLKPRIQSGGTRFSGQALPSPLSPRRGKSKIPVRGKGAGGMREFCDADGQPAIEQRATLAAGESLTLEKFVGLVSGLDAADPMQRARAVAQIARAQGYAAIRAANAAEWARTWETSDVIIEGDNEAQLALRFNIFQLMIAAPRFTDRASIGAKTLSGFGYRHHVFWDTEIFMLPLFTFTQPTLARNMLLYRWHNLPGARTKAAENGYEGAQFPWESGGDGTEVTPTWASHSTDRKQLIRIWTGDIEIHITADIAYAVMQYWHTTGDDDWMRDYGAEIVLDGAKFWASAARREADGKYHLRNVVGPDEYHDRIDDNAYTNAMAKWHLTTALELLQWLGEKYPAKKAELVAALGLNNDRLAHWADVIGCIYLPEDPETGLIEQFTGYFDLADADQSVLRDPTRSQSMQALLGIEGCAATQNLKQPDVLMLQYLLPDRFTPAQMRANYEYYDPRTDHELGSSLGPSISAVMACRMGECDWGYQHFLRAARADLLDVRGNAGDGIHGASAGGLWQAVVFGFAGLRLTATGWETHPLLPDGWTRLAFKFYYRGKLQSVDIRDSGLGIGKIPNPESLVPANRAAPRVLADGGAAR